jgi:hypothetical protein
MQVHWQRKGCICNTKASENFAEDLAWTAGHTLRILEIILQYADLVGLSPPTECARSVLKIHGWSLDIAAV